MIWLGPADGLLVGACPTFIAVEEELTAENEQPNPERKAQLMTRNPGAQNGSGNCSGNAARNQVHQQLRV